LELKAARYWNLTPGEWGRREADERAVMMALYLTDCDVEAADNYEVEKQMKQTRARKR